MEERKTKRREKKHLIKFSFHWEPFNAMPCMSSVSVTMLNEFNKSCFVCVMKVHPEWRSYLIIQLVSGSRSFRFRFSHWLLEMLEKCEDKQGFIKLCNRCSIMFTSVTKVDGEKTRIKVKMVPLENTVHNLEPEIKWSIRILPQVFHNLQLEGVFAWLSTLGGAHSALGDYFNKHAEIAWGLSVKQLQIALKIGDPVLAAHCKLFMAISLIQRNYLSRALKIVRLVHCDIVNDKRLQEKRLVNCCKAARVKLKYIRERQKIQKLMATV